ncbi:MAG: MarP family serine protease [Microbacteriaceae bacterium]
MPGFAILDIALVLVLLFYLIHGFRAGLVLSLGGLVGIIAGVVAAFFAIPLVSTWVTDATWRVPTILLVVLVLVVLGQTLGNMVGRTLRRQVDRTPLRLVDKVLGAIVNLVVAALLISMLAFSLGSLGVPFLSQAIASSTVVKTIDSLTPNPVRALLAQLRSLVTQDGLPRIINALEPASPPPLPSTSTDTPALNAAARSVVKIVGNASQCGQDQLGSGFVVAPGRVITNAHVVAGVTAPVIQPSGGGAWPGRVVFFDSVHDLAVIAVAGLPTKPLSLAANLSAGASAAFDGYPLGGPFQAQPATVQDISTVSVPDIYGQNPSPMQLYTLAANVQQGNSGGPLLNPAGKVVGVVFAKSVNKSSIGYALTTQELAPVVAKASSSTVPVASGHCTRK